MAYFPMFIDLKDQNCLVIGAGQVALRKVKTLLKYHPKLIVASTEFCEEIMAMIPEEDRISLPADGERNEIDILAPYMKEATLVVAASGNHDLNRLVGEHCREKNIPVNVIDAPELCTFVFPSVVVRGEISVGINTGTKSPALSKQIRKQVEKAIPDSYEQIAEWMAGLRDYVKEHYDREAQRRFILKTAASKAFESDRVLTEEELNDIFETVLE